MKKRIVPGAQIEKPKRAGKIDNFYNGNLP
jgi:hypothetical protein